MKSRYLFSLIATFAIFLFAASGSASAYEVAPIRHQLAPERGVLTGTFTITNRRAENLAVELVVLRRVYDEEGNHTLVEDDQNFIVFPPQMLIMPGKSAAVRFQYIGDPGIEISEGYVIDVREVPIQTESFTGFRFTYNFGVAVYVKAPRSRSDAQIVESYIEDGILNLQLSNNGKDFARLTNDRLTINADGKRIVLEGTDLTSRLDNPALPPLRTRKIAMDMSAYDLPDGVVNVTLRERKD